MQALAVNVIKCV